jgi:hypothetical protein
VRTPRVTLDELKMKARAVNLALVDLEHAEERERAARAFDLRRQAMALAGLAHRYQDEQSDRGGR